MFWYGRTDNELKEYLQTIWLPKAPPSDIDQLMVHYPQDPAQGSPYDTGDKYSLSVNYKRLASFQASLSPIEIYVESALIVRG